MFALDVRGQLVTHSTGRPSDDVDADMAGVAARDVPTAGVGRIDWATLVEGVDFLLLAVWMRDAEQLVTMATFEARFVDIVLRALVNVAKVKLEVTIMVGVELGDHINLTTLFPMLYNRNICIGHEITANHMVVATLWISAEPSACGGALKIFDGIVDPPSDGGQVIVDGCSITSVETMSAVVGD